MADGKIAVNKVGPFVGRTAARTRERWGLTICQKFSGVAFVNRKGARIYRRGQKEKKKK